MATITQTVRLVPSAYSTSNSVLTVTDPDRMYNNTDNTQYATATHTQKGTTAYYLYLKGFNFDTVPDSAVVKSFSIKFKAYESLLSTSSTYRPYICNDTRTLTGTCNAVTTSATTQTFTGVTDSFATIKGYGNNFNIRFTVRRNTQNTQGYLYIYGAEIEVTYELTTYSGTLNLYNASYAKTPEDWSSLLPGTQISITFSSQNPNIFKWAKYNGTSITPTYDEEHDTRTYTRTINEDFTLDIMCSIYPSIFIDGVEHHVTAIYKKVSGAWVEQPEQDWWMSLDTVYIQ